MLIPKITKTTAPTTNPMDFYREINNVRIIQFITLFKC